MEATNSPSGLGPVLGFEALIPGIVTALACLPHLQPLSLLTHEERKD